VRRTIESVSSPGATHFHPFSRPPARCEPHRCRGNDTLKSGNAAGELWHADRCDSSESRAEARLAPGMNEADTCRKQVVPLLQAAGWDDEPHSIAEQRTITDGRIVPAVPGLCLPRHRRRGRHRTRSPRAVSGCRHPGPGDSDHVPAAHHGRGRAHV
jgi:hypothetical protein